MSVPFAIAFLDNASLAFEIRYLHLISMLNVEVKAPFYCEKKREIFSFRLSGRLREREMEQELLAFDELCNFSFPYHCIFNKHSFGTQTEEYLHEKCFTHPTPNSFPDKSPKTTVKSK